MWSGFTRYVAAIFLLVLLLTIGTYIFFYVNLAIIRTNENWVTHSFLVKTALDDTLQKLTDAETGERGYIITGDKQYLAPYNTSLLIIQKDLATVKYLTTDNPTQQKRIPQLQIYVNQRLAKLKGGITLKEQSNVAADVFMSGGTGRILMDQTRQLIQNMQFDEDNLLMQRESQTLQSYQSVYITSAIALISNVLLLIIACLFFLKETQKRNEIGRVIQTSEKRFKSLIEHGNEGIALINKNNDISYVSPSVKKILGYSDSEYKKLKRITRVHFEDAESVQQIYKTLKPGQTKIIVIRFKNKRGKWVWLETAFTNMFNDTNVNARVVNFRDISERMELEKRKDDFVSMASHELKTPITSIKMYLDILQMQTDKYKDGQIKKYIHTLKKQVNKLKDLSADLLDVSRIETGKLLLRRENFLLNELVKEVIENIQLTTNNHKLLVKEKGKVHVYADSFRVYQVLTNLITNAIKYSPNSDKIIITIAQENLEGIISVQDFGIGIPKDKQGKIFDKLFQVADPDAQTFPGLGMGLYISKEIVEQHDGRLWLKSIKGKGSTFYFSLPLKK